jgi:hypothetical protein
MFNQCDVLELLDAWLEHGTWNDSVPDIMLAPLRRLQTQREEFEAWMDEAADDYRAEALTAGERNK